MSGKCDPVLVLARDLGAGYQRLVRDPLEQLETQGILRVQVRTRLDLEAGGSHWAHWIRRERPVALVLASYDDPDAPEILAYCHRRGVGVVFHVDEQAIARNWRVTNILLERSDVVHASTAAAAAAVRARFPAQRITVAAGPPEAAVGQLRIAVMQLAPRNAWQKVAGVASRAVFLARHLAGKVAHRAWGPVQRAGDPEQSRLNVLFVSNSFLPTLQLCFTRPLQPLVEDNEIAWEVLADIQLHKLGRILSGGRTRWARKRLALFRPDLVVFCRYSGAHAQMVTDWARRRGVPTIYHLDDDLLNVPAELGPEKYAFHNQPARLAAVRHLLSSVDLVYCSTEPLLSRMREHGIHGRSTAARVHCPGEVVSGPSAGTPLKIGYMGIDHAHDFQVALPALVRILDRNPHVQFELFGPIPMPTELYRFGSRVRRIEFVRSYDAFLRKFASLGWAIGICPLAETPFNRLKANNKWVEYTSVGIATVATAGMLYDECCADGCGLLASNGTQWEQAMQTLIDDEPRRLAIVAAAQARLAREYSPAVLRNQVRQIFDDVLKSRSGSPAATTPTGGSARLLAAEVGRGD